MDTLARLKVEIQGIAPPVWRKVVVPHNITLDRIHDVIVILMGWKDYHLHLFEINGQEFGKPHPEHEPPLLDEKRVKLSECGEEGGCFVYIYDFGDDWNHKIVIEKIYKRTPPSVPYPIWCLSGKGAAPPEDVGGPSGYDNFIMSIRNRNHPDHGDLRKWYSEAYPCKGMFEPSCFSVDETNLQLLRYLEVSQKPPLQLPF